MILVEGGARDRSIQVNPCLRIPFHFPCPPVSNDWSLSHYLTNTFNNTTVSDVYSSHMQVVTDKVGVVNLDFSSQMEGSFEAL